MCDQQQYHVNVMLYLSLYALFGSGTNAKRQIIQTSELEIENCQEFIRTFNSMMHTYITVNGVSP